jgi:hypothetical protein
MNSDLRVRHRRTWFALAVLVPGVLLAGLAARGDVPVDAGATERGHLPGPTSEPVATGLADADPAIAGGRWSDAEGRLWLDLEPTRDLAAPDVLVYWTVRPDAGEEDLSDAWLLGALRGRARVRMALPEGAAGGAGTLLLYSLGHRELVASAPLERSSEGER